MPDSPPPETLAWLRQTATANGATYSQVLLHLLERVEALEQRPIPGTVELAAPTPESAPLAAAAGGLVERVGEVMERHRVMRWRAVPEG